MFYLKRVFAVAKGNGCGMIFVSAVRWPMVGGALF